jgi:putative Ca2+/H+ antiporter (TMEM165/GDT1 family)
VTGLDPAIAASAFVPLLLVELPDKTFVATLVLATRYRPWYAWLGVGLAFGVQCLVAVTAGELVSWLPEHLVAGAAAVLFGTGALVLWRGRRAGAAAPPLPAEASEASDPGSAPGPAAERVAAAPASTRVRRRARLLGPVSAVGTSFWVVFLAEWGDLSQLVVAGLSARSGDPLSVFAGAWAALLVVAGLAAAVGGVLLHRLPVTAIRTAGAAVCLVLAVLSVAQALGLTPAP